eukprot:TRINITY_DN745_c0_g3_i1.p1 TRINITY_DN745_c0_g3~~TRINITY_DN745_c0_g3_i1.p1  ORF type:complete len:522 (+),score=145.15 TRINITY_DN745_c0_g3_i1:87-1652(+)
MRAVGVCGMAAILICLAVSPASATRPNLLLLMADQLRYDAVLRGSGHTPNIDSIGQQGAIFRNAYSSTPTCTPARAALLTGQKPWNHGMLGYGAIAPQYPQGEMPPTLRTAGYRTHAVGKDHFGWNATAGGPIPHGYTNLDIYDGLEEEADNYTRWFEAKLPGKAPRDGWPDLDYNSWRGEPYALEESLHPTAYVGQRAVDLLRSLRSAPAGDANPFFLKVSFHRPHSPYDPPQRLLDAVGEADLPPIRLCSAGGWDAMFQKGTGCGPTNPDAWCGEMPAEDVSLARRAYYASIRFVDEWVGEILAAVNTSDTLIIWTADHGDGQGDHFHWRKGYPYEFSAHVPMMLRWPESLGLSEDLRGVVSDAVSELRDVFPTMLDAAGVAAPSSVDGMSLLCAVDPSRKACGGEPWRDYLDLEHSTCYNASNHWNALTDGSMKYIFNANFPQNSTVFPQEQLFNLTADPFELQDVATHPEYASALGVWRQRLVDQFEQEGRGASWVSGGVLMQRTKGTTYSPNYPQA